MKFSPPSHAGLALLLLATVLAITAPAPGDRTKDGSAIHNAPRSKRSSRTHHLSEAEASVWLKQMIETTRAKSGQIASPRQLRLACKTLQAGALENLLGHPALHRESYSETQDSWETFVTLNPLREALLSQFAVLDLSRALQGFPSDAEFLVQEAARMDGAAALAIWLDSRDKWRKQPKFDPPCIESPPIFGIGFVPRIVDLPREQLVLNSLIKGWASSDAVGAWKALHSRELKADIGNLASGVITGLPEGNDWRQWSQHLQSLPLQEPEETEPHPAVKPVVDLTERWIKEDPEQAFAWFTNNEASWTEPMQGLVCAMEYAFSLGGSGSAPYISARSSLLSRWLHHEPDLALEWMDRTGVSERELVAEIVKWTDTPDLTKVRLMGQLEDSEEIRKLAAILADRQERRETPWEEHETAREKLAELLASRAASEEAVLPED